MDDIITCCSLMWSSVGEAGYKGFSVIICKYPGEKENSYYYRFVEQFRSLDPDEYEGYEGKVYIGERVLFYCSACGAKLETVIENNLEQFIKLAEEHKHLVLD